MKRYRDQSGLSAEQVARKLGIHRNMIYRWESGTAEPGAKKLYRFSRVVGTNISNLYGDCRRDEMDASTIEVAERLVEIERKRPGVIRRTLTLLQKGFLSKEQDIDDILLISGILLRRPKSQKTDFDGFG